jgi:Zn-dependent peptidase ImmA (M78 family)
MKLTISQINEIKELRDNGKTQMELAVKFGVSIGTIVYHTNEVSRKRQIEYSKNSFKNLTTEQRKQVYKKRKDYLNNYAKNYYKRKKELGIK